MPWDEVMGKWKSGTLHSGSKSGPKVTSQKQAVAIMLSEKRSGKSEYHSLASRHGTRKKGRLESMNGR